MKQRVDVVLVARGLAPSRERAQALILSGVVLVNGQPITKAGAQIAEEAELSLRQPDHPYVGRGGLKMARALDAFAIAVEGREALDIGASTGGFTDVLLQRGAARVVALDVGHGQLDWKLRNDPRVVVIERKNARTLEITDIPHLVDIVTIDVSFISLRHIFPRVPPLLRGDADVIALVKPQFEAGRAEVGKKGVVRDPDVQKRVVEDATTWAAGVGLMRSGMIESPITGDEGNREFLLHLREARVITRVGIVGKARLQAAAEHLAAVASWLAARNIEPVFDPDSSALARTAGASATHKVVEKERLPDEVDLVVVLGGDGTLLGVAGCIGQSGADIPILGVNFGSLGFLTEVTLSEMYPALEATVTGKAPIEERMMLRVQVDDDGRCIKNRVVLNDVVVTQGALSRVIDVGVSVDHEFMMRIRADGVIVASPTGSTAYNLSSGGPILHPRVDGVTITPIAPHTLTNRPVVVPGSSVIRIQPFMQTEQDEVFATFDGQSLHPLKRNQIVLVRRAEKPLRLIHASSRGYFQVLREKLKWGER